MLPHVSQDEGNLALYFLVDAYPQLEQDRHHTDGVGARQGSLSGSIFPIPLVARVARYGSSYGSGTIGSWLK